jgi:Flp pilus assembly protein TadG
MGLLHGQAQAPAAGENLRRSRRPGWQPALCPTTSRLDHLSRPWPAGREGMMRRLQSGKHHLLQRTEGATAVEFAIVLPVLLLILLGIMDFGNAYYQLHLVSEASRAGARYATVDPNLANIPTDVTNYVRSNYGNQLQVTTSPSPLVSGGNVTVTVTNSVTISTPLISAFFPTNPFTVTGRTVMTLEN